jgi:hypothetical protein
MIIMYSSNSYSEYLYYGTYYDTYAGESCCMRAKVAVARLKTETSIVCSKSSCRRIVIHFPPACAFHQKPRIIMATINPNHQAVHLNNRGVAYLEKGHLHKSFTIFRDALRSTMNRLGNTSESEVAAIAPIVTGSSEGAKLQLWKLKGMAAFASSKPTSRIVSPCDFMFSHGITLMEESSAYSLNDVVDITVASSIILFNLALVHHIKGLTESSSKYLIRAESFYCRSYQLIVDTGLDLGRSGNPVIDFLSMALLNNAAQVGRELCHSELSQEQFRKLLQVATQINAASYGEASIAQFMEETKNDFLLNAIVLCDQSRAAAA